MDQASRVIAAWSGSEDLVSRERLALGAWKKAVGKAIASHTSPVKLVRERLVVEVEDDIWRKNLFGLRFQILRNLERAIGPEIVADLEFRVMPARRDSARAESASGSLPLLSDESLGIADTGMRRIYRAARRRETA
jgi:predicted nucleic acid-binding Zn ribbon protein